MIGTLVVTDRAMARHDPGAQHPEAPHRLLALLDGLAAHPRSHCVVRSPRVAADAELKAVHDPVYVQHVLGLRGAERVSLDPDTHLSEGSVGAALLAAGAAIEAVDAVVRGAARSAFALVRPPGHHAEPARAMGFCLFNNVAVAVAHARLKLGVRRVLVIDWDVHCGNGTQAIFATDPDVVVFDVHRFPFYPFTGDIDATGTGAGRGATWNVPTPGGLGDGDHFRLFEEILAPHADAFAPELVVVSAGFDAHRDDPLGDQNITDEGFAALAGVAQKIADRSAGGRLALVLEGGYDVPALVRSVGACLDVLGGATPPEPRHLSAAGDQLLRRVAPYARRYWTPGER